MGRSTKVLLLSLALVAGSLGHVLAQEDVRPHNQHSVYLELLGTGRYYSINYEWRYRPLALRAGAAGMNVGNNYNKETSNVISIPVGLLLIANPEKNGGIELGFGYTATFGTRSYNINEGTKYPAEIRTYDRDDFPSIQLGYRLQPRSGGLIMRIDATLLYLSAANNKNNEFNAPYLQPWFGFSMGYTFMHRPKN